MHSMNDTPRPEHMNRMPWSAWQPAHGPRRHHHHRPRLTVVHSASAEATPPLPPIQQSYPCTAQRRRDEVIGLLNSPRSEICVPGLGTMGADVGIRDHPPWSSDSKSGIYPISNSLQPAGFLPHRDNTRDGLLGGVEISPSRQGPGSCPREPGCPNTSSPTKDLWASPCIKMR